MNTNFGDVGDFHQKFGLHYVEENLLGKSLTGSFPQDVPDDLLLFRIKFLFEELQEFLEGIGMVFTERTLFEIAVEHAQQGDGPDHPQMFDALIDLVYVALGTAHLLGYPWQEGWDLVQAANMAKVRAAKDGSDSKRGSQWDVVKPPGWTPPNIAGLLAARGFTS